MQEKNTFLWLLLNQPSPPPAPSFWKHSVLHEKERRELEMDSYVCQSEIAKREINQTIVTRFKAKGSNCAELTFMGKACLSEVSV